MKFRMFILYFLVFGFLADVALWLVVIPDAPLLLKLALCVPTALILFSLPFIGTGNRYTDNVRLFSYMIFIFGVPKFFTALLFIIGHHALGISRLPALLIAVVVGAALCMFFVTLIFIVSRKVETVDVELAFEDLPAGFDGFRICQLSDLHLGSFGKKNTYIKRVVDAALAQKPDVILFTGDLVNFESYEAKPYLEELARLHSPNGVIAIRGNHDYLLHGPRKGADREADTARLLEMELSLGWNVLLNSYAILQRGGDSIAVAGVENVSRNPYFLRTGGDLKKALEGIPEGIFTILMSHDPSHWRAEILPSSSVPLTLSGHTHGLKFKFVGFKPSHWRLPESSGIYTEGARVLHVSGGLGSAFAFRLGGTPKIEIIKLSRYGKMENDSQPQVCIGEDG